MKEKEIKRKKAKPWNPFALDNDKFFPYEAVSGVPRRLTSGCISLVHEQYRDARDYYERLRNEDPFLRMKKIEQQKRDEMVKENEESVVKAIDDLCEKVVDPSYYPRAFRHLGTFERLKKKRKQQKDTGTEVNSPFASIKRHASLDPLSWMECRISELEEKVERREGKHEANEILSAFGMSEGKFIGTDRTFFRNSDSTRSVNNNRQNYEHITKSDPGNDEGSVPFWRLKSQTLSKTQANILSVFAEPTAYGDSIEQLWKKHECTSDATRISAERYDRIATLQSGWLNGVDQETLLNLAERNALREQEGTFDDCYQCDENIVGSRVQDKEGEHHGSTVSDVAANCGAVDTVVLGKRLIDMENDSINFSEYRMQKSDIRHVPRKMDPLRSRGRFICKMLRRLNKPAFDFTEMMKET